jgi:pSer/pThr/pTyr-binding forkhead associated (FHA) protein
LIGGFMAKLVGLSEQWKGQEYPLFEGGTSVGRVEGNDLVFVDPTVSSRHAKLFFEDGRWRLEDLGSTNGTTVNGEPVQIVDLQEGDEVIFGGVQFRLALENAEGFDDLDEPVAKQKPKPPAPTPARTGETAVISGIDLSADADGGPPESFESISPFASKNRTGMNLWAVVLGILGILALAIVGYVLYRLLGNAPQ